ncbi:MAG TPA: radical SAM protein [Bacteroidota bacterium]|nr:radical SAM protein [Bacteroidota bacterium]
MNFPRMISFTITNRCNLRCQMCGQWSQEGYIANDKNALKQKMELSDWKRLVNELYEHRISSLLLRGGEPLMFPGIVELLEYVHSKGIFISIDTNGTLLKKYAADILRIGDIHITISVDGPEQIHDQVRGVTGCFKTTEEGLLALHELELVSPSKISKSICFTISPYSLAGLGEMPDVARHLGIQTLVIVPYNYIPQNLGHHYERELREHFGCTAFSWQGFHHEDSEIDFEEFQKQHQKYLANLGELYSYPYLPLTENEFRDWFQDATIPVKSFSCSNAENLIDIQPNGEANFCVDTPDYSIGNVQEATIENLWTSDRAKKFREYRKETRFGACYRCVSKYMSETVRL